MTLNMCVSRLTNLQCNLQCKNSCLQINICILIGPFNPILNSLNRFFLVFILFLFSPAGNEIFITRLLGRFAPIFYLNCEHVLFVYILKQSKKKISRIFKKKFADFKDLKFFTKIKNFFTQFF